MNEPTKTIRDDSLGGGEFQHPAYGVATLGSISGQTDLFMVDYPQQHYIRLSLHTATHHRTLSNDWVHPKKVIADVYFSEVQWARFISSTGNGSGVPCTLGYYRDPQSGELLNPSMHNRTLPKAALFANEVKQTAKDAADALDEAAAIAKRMSEGGALKKGDLAALTAALSKSQRELGANLPFVVEQAEEAIETAVESAKGEIEAYQQFSNERAGRLALAERQLLLEGKL